MMQLALARQIVTGIVTLTILFPSTPQIQTWVQIVCLMQVNTRMN